MNIIYTEYNIDHNSIDIATTAGYLLRIELENIKETWRRKYHYAISNWENNWEDVSPFFQFPDDIRRIMYTTNIIEGLNQLIVLYGERLTEYL